MLLALLFGCPEYNPTKIDPNKGETYAPDIAVDPLEIAFDALEPGQSDSHAFSITNVGDALLTVESVQIEGTSAFTLDGETSFTLDAGATREMSVGFSPINVEDSARLHIVSDDADSPEIIIPVSGTALVPELMVSPNPLDLGSVPVGCSTDSMVTLSNVGLATLVISSLIEVGEGFTLEEHEVPISLAPGDSVDVGLGFTAEQLETNSGQLWITSNDMRGTVIADHWGTGSDEDSLTEGFLQGDGPWDLSDVMVYVDQSGSMTNDQENLASNIEQLTDAFTLLDVDYQLMAVVDDSGCHNGSIWTPDNPPTSTQFLSAIRGSGGTYTEAGLTISANALAKSGTTGCNAGFLREDSKTTLVLVSDEPEQSPKGWMDMVNEIQGYSANVVIDVIVGDYPEGCETAYPGSGYAEAAALTGGAMLSICSPDWGSYFDEIATITATGVTDTFVLANHPDPSTIAVTVDGTPSLDWTYNADLNAIVFDPDAVPEAKSYINVVYRLDADCDQ